MKRHRSSSRGFTLIELLVVVAIIALLISILLPSLQRAKEQARIAKCLSNLANFMRGAVTYEAEFGDFGWGVKHGNQAPQDLPPAYRFAIYSEASWGGAIPDITQADWVASDADLPHHNYAVNQFDFYKVPPRLRPMNRYMAPSVTWDCEPDPTPATPRTADNLLPSETPDSFKCPSDSHPYLPWVGESNELPDVETAYESWKYNGNSYMVNWYWPYYYQRSVNGGPEPGYGNFLDILGVYRKPVGLGKKMMKNKDGRFASEFCVFVEGNLDFALEAAKPPGYTGQPWDADGKQLMGWHRQFNKHIAGFLDGGARHQIMDTRFVFGQGWTIWPNKPWTGTWATYNDRAPGY